jgi:hypothetical protein
VTPRTRSPWWAAPVAVAVTVVLAAVARLVLGRNVTVPAPGDGGAYAPEPLTGDPTSIDAHDVAPV